MRLKSPVKAIGKLTSATIQSVNISRLPRISIQLQRKCQFSREIVSV